MLLAINSYNEKEKGREKRRIFKPLDCSFSNKTNCLAKKKKKKKKNRKIEIDWNK
jgi:hypothetical protein